jgi:hypothetical protein
MERLDDLAEDQLHSCKSSEGKLVNSAKDYPWSSFRAFYSDVPEPLTVDKGWWWPDDSEKLSNAMKEMGWRSYHKRSQDD